MCHIWFYCLQSGCKVLQRHQIHDNLTLCRLVLTSAENTRLHARIPRTIHRLFCSDENSSQKLLSSLVCKLLYFIRLVVSCLCYKKKNPHVFKVSHMYSSPFKHYNITFKDYNSLDSPPRVARFTGHPNVI